MPRPRVFAILRNASEKKILKLHLTRWAAFQLFFSRCRTPTPSLSFTHVSVVQLSQIATSENASSTFFLSCWHMQRAKKSEISERKLWLVVAIIGQISTELELTWRKKTLMSVIESLWWNENFKDRSKCGSDTEENFKSINNAHKVIGNLGMESIRVRLAAAVERRSQLAQSILMQIKVCRDFNFNFGLDACHSQPL